MGLTPESYHAVFNSIPDHVAIIEKSGVIVETNTAWNADSHVLISHTDVTDTAASHPDFNATSGALIGLPVRSAFEQALNLEWRRAMRQAAPVSLIMLDSYTDRVFALMFGATNEAVAAGFANHIVRALRNLNIAHEQSQIAPFVTASVGLATLRPKRGYTENMLLQLTQQALYDAQDRGGNTVVTNRVRVL